MPAGLEAVAATCLHAVSAELPVECIVIYPPAAEVLVTTSARQLERARLLFSIFGRWPSAN